MEKEKKEDKYNLKIKSEDIDPGALFIIKRLNDSGYEAFVVGGCIRNLIMGVEARDWDITTKAAPEEIVEVFRDDKVIPVGKKFGTLTVIINHINYEVSTFKKNKSVLTPNLLEDLGHRDFTINALAWKEGEGAIDCFNGLEDIKQKIIKGVENPKERIKEDPLRMLRAIRLACELDFKIDKATLRAIEKNILLIKKVSIERIRDELEKCVGIYRKNFCEGEDLLENTLSMVASLPSNLNLRLSVLLYNIKNISHFDEKKEIVVKISVSYTHLRA